jgi:DNA-binding XRE family transcriptional regulator
MAARLNNKYGAIERGDCNDLEGPNVGRLTPLEKAVVLRIRNKLKQKELADMIGVSRFALNRMEAGEFTDAKLMEFWGCK